MIIRPERPADLPSIYTLTEQAFGQPMEAELVESLRTDGVVVLSLVAEEAGEITGHVLFSRLEAPIGCAALAPISVRPQQQKKGIGGQLIEAGLSRLEKAGWQAVFLLGNPAYYERFGFEVALADKFETPYPKECVMAVELTAGALEDKTGALQYADAFNNL